MKTSIAPKGWWSVMLLVAIVLSSCSNSKDVVSNGLVQKRKYRSGYHLNGLFEKKNTAREVHPSSAVAARAEQPEESVSEDEPVVSGPAEALNKPLDAPLLSRKSFSDVPVSEGAGTAEKLLRKIGVSREIAAAKAKTEPNRLSEKKPYLQRVKAGEVEKEGILSIALGGGNFLLTWWIPIIGLGVGIAAIIFGVRAVKSSDETTRLLGIIGIVLGALSVLANLIISLYWVAVIALFI